MTHYEVLGVGEKATTEEIRRAYRRQARDHHPDANPADPAAGERFRRLAEAYEVLSDPVRRSWYDAAVGVRQGGGAAGGSAPGPGPRAGTAPPGPSPGRPGPPGRSGPPPGPRPAPAPGVVADRILQVAFTAPFALVPWLAPVGRVALVAGGWFLVGYLLRRHAQAAPVAYPWWRSPGWAGAGRLVRVGAAAAGLLVGALLVLPLAERVRDAIDAQGVVEDAAEAAAPPAAIAAARVARDDAVDAAAGALWRVPAGLVVVVAAWLGSARLPAVFGFPDRRARRG
jgi:hypothetical protein